MRRDLSLVFLASPLALALSISGACADGEPAKATNGTALFDPSTSSGGLDPDAACAKFEHAAIAKPVNLYIMFDKSSSMAGSKWDAAIAGLEAFVTDPDVDNTNVALRFFPRDVDATPACDMKGYQQPTVPFGALPGNGDAIKAALAAESPDGFSTPMWPALGGGILKGIELAESHPDERSAVLLVTDGAPAGPADSCSGVDPEDPQEIANLAATGADYDPPVPTFVVGLPGVDQTTAEAIASAGGTGAPILVSATNVEAEFTQALAQVRGEAVPCAYEMPQEVLDGEIEIGQVNVQITPDGEEPYLVPQNPSCNGEGWHYDASPPTEILLCPATCDQVKSNFQGEILVLLGCQTYVP